MHPDVATIAVCMSVNIVGGQESNGIGLLGEEV